MNTLIQKLRLDFKLLLLKNKKLVKETTSTEKSLTDRTIIEGEINFNRGKMEEIIELYAFINNKVELRALDDLLKYCKNYEL